VCLVGWRRLAAFAAPAGYLFIAYTAARYGWYVAYKLKLNGTPPLRTLCFAVTKLSTVVVLVMTIVVAFGDSQLDGDRRL
jgi:hypothetical protein